MNWLRGPLGSIRIVLLLIAGLGMLIGMHGWQIHERFQYIKTGFHSTQATVELLIRTVVDRDSRRDGSGVHAEYRLSLRSRRTRASR